MIILKTNSIKQYNNIKMLNYICIKIKQKIKVERVH